MRGVLTKGRSSNRNLRTSTVEGVFSDNPEVGKPFIMLSESLDEKKDFRYVRTSLVLQAQKTTEGYTFETLNSVYSLEVVEKEEKIHR